MPDIGHIETESILRETEADVQRVYRKAVEETQKKLDDYLRRFEVKDNIKRQQLNQGKITAKEYADWRKGQIMIGQRWEEMRDTLAQDLHNSNNIARSIVRGHMPEVYAVNHNYATFQIEKGSMVDTSYTLYNRQTVERIIRDQPDLLPKPGKRMSERIAANKDVAWQRGQIQSVTLQSILQGESIPKMANRIAREMGETNYKSTVRYARTAMTGAQNAGRTDAYKRAEDMGIEMEQEWLATLDGRTRHSHRQMDGQHVKVGEKFSNGCRFPGDPDGPGSEIWNCRCTLVPRIEGIDQSNASRNSKLGDMSYEEWKGAVDEVKTPSLRDMIEADSDKYSAVQKNALLYYADNGQLPKNISGYQKKKLQGVINQYSDGVQGRDVEFKKVSTPSKFSKPSLPTKDQYKLPEESRKNADRWVKDEHIAHQYTDKQLQAMESYMMESDDINGMLRGYSSYHDKSVVGALSSCMSEYEYKDSVYRGIDGKILGIREGESAESVKKKLVGKSYRDKGFMSTSRSYDVAKEFSQRGAFDEFEAKSPCVLVLNVHGVDVAYLNSGLAEVLLDKGSTITYTDVVKEDGIFKIFGMVK